MKRILLLNPENASEDEVATYEVREAARAVVVDGEGQVALLHVTRDDYYKLPGGGIEDGENKKSALERECEEEIGCDIDMDGEVGMVVEYRKFLKRKQVSYCYTARVKGGKGSPQFTDSEVSRGFELIWVSYDEALRLMEESAQTAKSIEGKLYIVPRDTVLLKAASIPA